MFIFFVIPMITFFTLESLLWKRNRKSPLETLFGTTTWSLIVVTVAFLVTLTFVSNVFQAISWEIIGFTALQVVLVIVNIILWVNIMKSMPLSIAEPLALFRIVVMTVAAWLIFGGAITTLQIIFGSVIVAACCILAFLRGRKREKNNSTICRGGNLPPVNYARGIICLVFWIATSVGLGLIIQHIMRQGVRPITHAWIQTGMIFVAVLTFYIITRAKQLPTVFKSTFRDINHAGIGLGGVGGRVMFSFALSIFAMNVGVLNAINVATVALVVLLSALFYKERVPWYSYALIAIIVGSATVISLGI